MMTLDEIRQARAKIDGAPWKYENRGQTVFGHSPGGCNKTPSDYMVANIRGWGHLQYMGKERGDGTAQALQDANGEFIAKAPEYVDFLLAEIARLESECFALAAGTCSYRGGNEHGNPLCLKTNELI